MSIKAKNTEGKLVEIDSASLEKLKATVHGKVILPQEEEYANARKIWNAMIDRRPAFIVQCSGTADVIRTVRFAAERKLLISVRGAGHNIAGRALEDDVILIDLSQLRYVHVDPQQKIAIVSPGATLADVDQETGIYGLAMPTGINSTTGVAGLTLGGGFGWLSRKYGMTIDNLIAAEVVTVEGERIVCNNDQHQDLFWAIRGGGGNFGIVTSFTFKLHQMEPTVMAGPIMFDIKDAKDVMRKYRESCKTAPDELCVWTVMRQCPPFPFINTSYHGKVVLIVVGVYSGKLDEGKKALEKIKGWGPCIGDGIGEVPFANFQKTFDALLTPGARNYWKTLNFKAIDDKLIDTFSDQALKIPNPYSEIFLAQVGGATNRIAKNATAYPHRDIEFVMNVHTRWLNQSDDKACTTFARGIFDAAKPFAVKGAYVNFVSEGDDSLDAAYSENIAKLAAIKAKYDPKNMLRSNLNIAPKGNA